MDNNELLKILGSGSQDVAQAMMICKSLHQNLGDVMQKMSDDFVGEGIDVSSVLPSMDEALYFKNFYIEVLKIYGWDPECNDESELLPAVRDREEYYDTYFDAGLNLVKERDELKEEVEKLKKENEEMKKKLPFDDWDKQVQEQKAIDQAKQLHESQLHDVRQERDFYRKKLFEVELELEKIKEGNEVLSSMVKMYKAQIPKKPGKKLSQRDKVCLSCVRDILGQFASDDKLLDEGDRQEEDWYDDETLKLLDRLLK